MTGRLIAFAGDVNPKLVEMEKKSLKEVCLLRNVDPAAIRKFIVEDLLKTGSNPSRLAELLALTWWEIFKREKVELLSPLERKKLLRCVYGENELSPEDYSLLVLSSESCKSAFISVEVEVAKYPWLVDDISYEGVYNAYKQTAQTLSRLANCISTMAIFSDTLQVLTSNPFIAEKLSEVEPSFDPAVIQRCQKQAFDIRKEWNDLLVAFRDYMPQHPKFQDCSKVQTINCQNKMEELDLKPISQWIFPAMGGIGMREIAETLRHSQSSLIYLWLWQQQCLRESDLHVSSSPEETVIQWKESIDRCVQNWKATVQSIHDQQYDKAALLDALSSIIEDQPPCPEIPNESLQARDIFARYLRQIEKHRSDCINAEVNTTFQVLGGLRGVERQAYEKVLIDFLSAAAFQVQAVHLIDLSRILNCVVEDNDPLLEYCRLMKSDNSKLLHVVQAFNAVKQRYPFSLQIQNQFPLVLISLIREGGPGRGFLNLLQRFISRTLLNQMVARIITEVPPTTHVLLVALQQARDAFELIVDNVDCYAAFCQAKMQSLAFLFQYLNSVGWCISCLRKLVNGIDTIFTILDDGFSGTNVVRTVHALMRTGEFIISLPDARFSATYMDGDGNMKELNSVELGDIPFQLCLTGTTGSGNEDENELGIHGDQSYFLAFIELMGAIREILLKLSSAGHPEYQQSKLIVPGSESLGDLRLMLDGEKEVLLEWQQFLASADINLPLLSCLTRKQLVDSMRLMANRDDLNTLASLLRSVYPVLSESDTTNIVTRFFQQPQNPANDQLNASQLSREVHELLKKGVKSLLPTVVRLTNSISAILNSFKARIPMKLKSFESSERPISVIVLPKQDSHILTEVTCALYIARFGRFPAAVEVFSCNADSDELSVTDFIRRWYSSQAFMQYLPVEQRKMMFTLINVEQLKPVIQNTLVAKIHAHRRSISVPLMILAAAEHEMDSVLCAGLRSDWIPTADLTFVRECRPLLSAFLNFSEPLIQVYSSPEPSSGKSTAILENFVLPTPGNNKPGQPYAKIPISGDFDEAIKLLSNVERDRQLAQCGNIILHLNITNVLDVNLLNRFLLSYIIVGVMFDSSGRYAVRNRTDTIIIEWPSEGVLARKAAQQCGLSSSFIQKKASNTIHFHDYIYRPCVNREEESDNVLYFVDCIEDNELKIGTQMMLAYFEVAQKTFIFPHHETVTHVILPGPEILFSVVRDKLQVEGGSLPSPGIIYRFHRFFTNQLIGLYHFSMYEMASQEQEARDTADEKKDIIGDGSHCRNFRKLAYYFADCSFNLAVKLSAEAVEPLTDDYAHDDTRLEKLKFNFSNWKGQNFLIFSSGNMPEMVCTSGKIFLEEIVAGDKDPAFRRFLEQEHKGSAGNTIQALCCQLSDPTYEPEQDQSHDHALRRLLSMIGDEENFAVLIFEQLRVLKSSTCPANLSPDQPITNLSSGALRQLRKIVIQHSSHGNNEINDDDFLGDDKSVGDFSNRARDWFQSIVGSYTSSSPPFVLTVDNLVRLLAIKIRLACKIPVVFVGETGSGKTHLVAFYCRVSGCLFEIINVHGGMKPEDLLGRILDIVKRSKNQKVVILLDEVNSMPSVWTIKELVCERFILGHRIPSNVRFICIMNPRRRRRYNPESSGLDFSPYQGKRGVEVVENKTPLVYEVHRSPESVMSLAWDFGNPSDSLISRDEATQITHERTPFPHDWNTVTDELLFAESMTHWLITSQLLEFTSGIEIDGREGTGLYHDFQVCEKADNQGVAHFRFLRALLCALLKVSQEFMRAHFHDVSAASLRDIARTISLIPFAITTQQRFVELNQSLALNVKYLYFKFLDSAVHVSFTLNYGLRLGGPLRGEYFTALRGVWDLVRNEHKNSISSSFLPVPLQASHIYGAFDQFAISLCGALSKEDGMAINEALKENVTSLFCSIMGNQDTGIAQFIVGRPGSTKSSSLDILCASTDPNSTDPRCAFFRTENWFEVRKFVLQCTPDTTADDILRVAMSAVNYQSINENCRCVIVLEEVGVTVGSVHNPLMVLHGLVDRGVLMSNGKYIRLPIVGISNWRLDASKMNRMRTTHRGNPSVADLMETAHCIMSRRGAGGMVQFDQSARDSLRRFAQTFSDYVLSEGNSSEDIKRLGWFYGMRDFYAFVQLLQMHHSQPLAREMGFQVDLCILFPNIFCRKFMN